MEEASVLFYDIDSVVVRVRRQEVGSAVCGNDVWTEWFLDSKVRTGVSKAESATQISKILFSVRVGYL